MFAALKGYTFNSVMPEKMSEEKVSILKALGAEITRTPTSAGFTDPEGNIATALRISQERPNTYMLDQVSTILEKKWRGMIYLIRLQNNSPDILFVF